jgi:hypothetical protein
MSMALVAKAGKITFKVHSAQGMPQISFLRLIQLRAHLSMFEEKAQEPFAGQPLRNRCR